jgi:hypothetical protein
LIGQRGAHGFETVAAERWPVAIPRPTITGGISQDLRKCYARPCRQRTVSEPFRRRERG